eukprot:COSAG02_NODE_619_length_19446_cov_9.557141_3_plen_69_part_00
MVPTSSMFRTTVQCLPVKGPVCPMSHALVALREAVAGLKQSLCGYVALHIYFILQNCWKRRRGVRDYW